LQELAILKAPIYVSEPRELADIGRAIRDYEILTGKPAGNPSEADRVDQTIAALRQRYQQSSPLSVFYQVWNEPLQTLNGDHLISKVIEVCGGHNAFADAASLAPRISIEAVLERDPDVIVASGMAAARPEWLDQWLDYPFLKAVKNDSLFFVHPDHLQRPTARVLLGAEELCKQLDSRR
jgi:iron complex transport system substrate-binding protein